MNAIEVRNLVKIYDQIPVVNGLNLTVKKGQVFGFLGPNGAGKTTTLEMIEGLRTPNEGEIFINGLNIAQDLDKIKAQIGVQLQSSVLDERIRVYEALELFASYYNVEIDTDALLALVNLTEKKNSMQKDLSGGQRQRLSFALCLVNDPEIIFLDEPTTGLDPQARRNLWDLVNTMKSRGKTVVITTHYMDEAEKLCDQVAIIDHGQIITSGTPQELIKELEAERIIEVSCDETALEKLKKIASFERVEWKLGLAELYTNNLEAALRDLMSLDNVINLDTLHIRKATLEDVFIHRTGRSLRE
jgi:ABC-2 type transport system ATP-binding protein